MSGPSPTAQDFARGLTPPCIGSHLGCGTDYAGCHNSIGFPSGSCSRVKRPILAYVSGSLTSIPAARSWATILSMSCTRKLIIQTLLGSPKYLVVSGKGVNEVGPASCCQTLPPSLVGVSEIPRCCWYHCPNALGSCDRKNNPPIPATFPISVPPDSCLAGAFAGGAGLAVCAEFCAAMDNPFRGRMKLDPKA